METVDNYFSIFMVMI